MKYIDLAENYKREKGYHWKKGNEKYNKQLLEEGIDLKNRFYVYVYLSPLNPGKYAYGTFNFDFAPFYVGKGTGERCFDHLFEKGKKLKHLIINKIKTKLNRNPIIIKVIDHVEENIALEVEKYLIESIGRICNSTGILTNLMPGDSNTWED